MRLSSTAVSTEIITLDPKSVQREIAKLGAQSDPKLGIYLFVTVWTSWEVARRQFRKISSETATHAIYLCAFGAPGGIKREPKGSQKGTKGNQKEAKGSQQGAKR